MYPGGQVHISKVEWEVKLMFIFNNNNMSSLVSLERFDLKIINLILFNKKKMVHKALIINKLIQKKEIGALGHGIQRFIFGGGEDTGHQR